MTRIALSGSFVAVALLTLATCSGKDGKSCTVKEGADGSAVITCEDGTSVTVPAGRSGSSCTVADEGNGTKRITCTDGTTATVGNGADGGSCRVRDADGGKLITCDDGTSALVTNGANGTSCSIADNGDGSKTIRCEDGTTVTVKDGANAASALVTSHHGEDHVLSSGEFASGKFFADAVITGASATDAGVVSVDFRVARASGAPVVDVPSISANIARLESTTLPAPANLVLTRWVPYIYRTETVVGTGYPRPAGSTALQAYRESNGTLVNHGDGTYRYTFATNVANVVVGGMPVPFDRTKRHRVSIMMGGRTGATASATFDFVPSGATDATTRDIVRTSACRQCHGANFQAHGGDRLTVENCVTCHAPGSSDAQGGETLDLKVMVHKIHMGGDLPTVRGPDGNPWLTADNGSYAIWGFQNQKFDWWKVGFPARVNNCSKCHDRTGGDSDAWKTKPTAAACGSCHDNVNFMTGANHPPGPAADDRCVVCHPASGGLVPLSIVHDTSTTDANSPAFDARNLPEFTLDVTMTPPANGTDYRGNEAPVVRVVIKRNGTPLADHRIQSGVAQGCRHTVSAVLCDPDADGRFANAGLFVSGPRARAQPVLTSAARAFTVSPLAGPFDLSAAGASLVLRVDQGVATVLPDAWGTRVPGVIAVPVSSGTWPGGAAAATTDQVVAWLNGNASFAARAIAWNEAGRVGIRSRNLGNVFGLQLQASAVATAVFPGDTTPHMPFGFTTSNQLTSTTDQKVTRFVDRIEYALDPVTDLAPGTYVVNLEIGQLGRVSATDYVTPSVKRLTFNVKTATEEKPIANNCDTCHQSTGGGAFAGLVVDLSRHNKVLDEGAVDQCHACHDYQPQSATDASGLGAFTGAKPISRRVHAIHYGSSLKYPLRTVDYSNGDPTVGRNWDITFPQPVLNCEVCHGKTTTSGTWHTNPNRLACSGCHDTEAASVHMKLNTDDPTPADPWSGDETESCKACH